jgi:CheY-like chemotaxis protein
MPDLVVLDLKLPRVDGLQVLRWLKSNGSCSELPTIILSNSEHERDIQEAYRLGANTFFTKPSSLEKLRDLFKLVIYYWASSQRPEVKARC